MRWFTKAGVPAFRRAVLGCVALGTLPAPALAAPVTQLLTRQATAGLGITADGAAALLVAVQAASKPSTATVMVTNEATLVAYDPAYSTTAPAAGSTSLTVSGSQIVQIKPGIFVLALLQSPDLLKPGPDGGTPDLTKPIVVSITLDGTAQPARTVTLYPPAVMLVHGLWGTKMSLADVQAYLAQTAPWKNLPPAFLTAIQYENDAAFDSTVISTVMQSSIGKIESALTAAGVAAGRVDIVSHSMGGLVSRHYSALSAYTAPPSRTLGAFHQIITINTPETGSLLANFLLVNANTEFTALSGPLAYAVKLAACFHATTVAECFADIGDNLAPPNQPITAGALYSLQPDSPNIAALPSANIPNAPWHALSSLVGQSSSLFDFPNALVFEIDELIAATCPGPSYCPSIFSSPPKVGNILGSKQNDGIVALASQIAGNAAPVTLPALAHTHGAGKNDLTQYVLNYANVLQSPPAYRYVGCWLSNTQCPVMKTDEQQVASAPAPWPGFDATRPWRNVDRLSGALPASVAMGTPFPIRIRYPLNRIARVTVLESNDADVPLPALHPQLTPTPDGQAWAMIPPLLAGKVTFRIRVDFTDYASSHFDFTLPVGAPEAAPSGFWADDLLHQLGAGMVLHLAPGETSLLQPVAVFASAPNTEVPLTGAIAFRVPAEAADIVSVDQAGNVTALRAGAATVECMLGRFTTKLRIDVAAPLE
jgi:hypothetical protein